MQCSQWSPNDLSVLVLISPPSPPPLAEQLYPQVFDGAKIIIQKGLSRYFQTTHTITLGSDVQPSQWQFGATYVGSKAVGENEVG